jgi:hypothetical protein
MKTIAFLALILTAPAVLAAPPKKAPDSNYTHLYTNSPFTSKPLPPKGPDVVDTFEDWALGGVSEIEGGYMVTLFHKKNAGETQVIRPRGTMVSKKDEMEWLEPGAPGTFKVERVEYGKESWKDTVVVLSGGSRSGQVKFDEKLIVPKASAPPQQQQARQPGQPGQPPVQNQANQVQPQGGRAPRQRVLPPTPPGQNQNQGRRGGR